MRGVVWAGLVAACGSSAAPHDAAIVAMKHADAALGDAAVDAKVVNGDWWQVVLAAIPMPSVTGDPAARYKLAATAGDRDRALGILRGLAADHPELVYRAMADDAFRPYWGSDAFRALIWSAGSAPQPEPGGELVCPTGTRQHGKLDRGGDGIVFCTKPDGTQSGPYIEHHSGCSLGEGSCGATGSYKDGKRDGVWIEGGHYEITTMKVFVAGEAKGLERAWHKDLETWTFTDAKGRTDTTVIADDGHVIEHGTTTGGRPDGPYERFGREAPHPLEENGVYIAGRKDGPWLAYSEGRPRAETSYALGVPNGAFRYWDKAGRLLAKTTIDHGTGAWVAYDGDTKIEEGALVNGAREGKWLIADTAGSRGQGSYAAGVRDGHWMETSGGVTAVGEYHAGARGGTWRLVDVFGKKIGEGEYVKGKREGAWTFWRTSSTLLAKGRFVADKPDGAWTIFGDDGVAVAQHLGFRAGVLATVDGKRATQGQAFAASVDPPHVIVDRD